MYRHTCQSLQLTINLECGRKMEYQEKAHIRIGRTCKLHKGHLNPEPCKCEPGGCVHSQQRLSHGTETAERPQLCLVTFCSVTRRNASANCQTIKAATGGGTVTTNLQMCPHTSTIHLLMKVHKQSFNKHPATFNRATCIHNRTPTNTKASLRNDNVPIMSAMFDCTALTD
ncbi:uncharacterized protein ACBT44_020892 [Syngnathus typhle]